MKLLFRSKGGTILADDPSSNVSCLPLALSLEGHIRNNLLATIRKPLAVGVWRPKHLLFCLCPSSGDRIFFWVTYHEAVHFPPLSTHAEGYCVFLYFLLEHLMNLRSSSVQVPFAFPSPLFLSRDSFSPSGFCPDNSSTGVLSFSSGLSPSSLLPEISARISFPSFLDASTEAFDLSASRYYFFAVVFLWVINPASFPLSSGSSTQARREGGGRGAICPGPQLKEGPQNEEVKQIYKLYRERCFTGYTLKSVVK